MRRYTNHQITLTLIDQHLSNAVIESSYLLKQCSEAVHRPAVLLCTAGMVQCSKPWTSSHLPVVNTVSEVKFR